MSASGAPKVFISYRREETAGHAGRLYDVMSSRFGDTNVFMDVDMAPGVDFVERIKDAVGGCHVLLVIIGPRWSTITNGSIAPRLADPGDFVRLEVEEGLRRGDVTVIPVLVGGARMPGPSELPKELHPLSRRNALELSDSRWRYDVERLLGALDRLLAGTSAVHPRIEAAPAQPVAKRIHGWSLALGAVIGAAVAAPVARAFADLLRWGPKSDGDRVLQPVLLQGLTWAVIGAVVALWLAVRGPERRAWVGALLAGGLTGAAAGAATAAIDNVPRFLIHPRPSESTLDAATVVGLAVTGAIVGALVGWVWDRRGSLGLAVGLVAGAALQLLMNAASWDASRPVTACIQATVIIGATSPVLARASP